jgi:hypothetical protein
MIGIRFALLSLMLFTLPGCRTGPLVTPLTQHVSDGQKSYEEFQATIKSFPYSTSPERRDLVVKNYPGLRVGMTKQQVAALIGNPDYSQQNYGPKGPGEHWLGSSWNYVLFKREDSSNENDPTVEVFFGTDYLLFWAAPSGISGLSEVGSCCQKPK